ncbi:EmrB/QacA subfamily drug resistance transporter [Streptosporangium album]|uniref:EmrB/QacA subfamily drug resistance transporter n=1 Tax=Streptosporangium album TaxID=47479 RepID=A0A7W7S5V3_9ACTN|nr:MDR family MFS transporter [Streptosporangium album]MBB4944424.1 EmrB/QacA subfamily drug resistance transporter [Streptosporangium album]
MTRAQIRLVMAGLMLAMLLAALDQMIVATALPTIAQELGGLDQLSWVVTSYLLASTAGTPLYGKLSDLYGRKRVFQSAIVIFLIGSILCGLAQNMAQLIVFRGVQGLGGGGLMALAMAIIADVVPPRDRGRYQGLFGGVFGLASVAGPLVGGFFTDHSTWRWIFWINLPLGVVALAVVAVTLHLPGKRVQHSIDYLGAVLLVAAVCCILMVTVWGGRTYDWSSWQIIGLAGVGTCLAAAFAAWQRRVSEPILPPRVIAHPVVAVSAGLSLLSGVALFGAIVYLPAYFQIVRGDTATESGLALVPLTGGVIVSSMVSGWLISKTGRYKAMPILGATVLAAGLYLLSLVEVDTSMAVLMTFTVVVGLGVGGFMQVPLVATQNAVRPGDIGSASSAIAFFRTLGGSLGTALFGTVQIRALEEELRRAGLPAQAVQLDPELLKHLPAMQLRELHEAFTTAVQAVYLWAIPFAIASLLLALFLKEIPLHGRTSTRPGAVTLAVTGVALTWLADRLEHGGSPRLVAAAARLVPADQAGDDATRARVASRQVLRPLAGQVLLAALTEKERK